MVDGAVVINDSATVIQADVLGNGVTHVIDAAAAAGLEIDVGIPQRASDPARSPPRGRAGPTAAAGSLHMTTIIELTTPVRSLRSQ